MFAYCGLAWLPGNQFPKTGKEIRTKQKAGNDGRKSEKTSMRNECTCVNRNISVFRTMKTPYKRTIAQRRVARNASPAKPVFLRYRAPLLPCASNFDVHTKS